MAQVENFRLRQGARKVAFRRKLRVALWRKLTTMIL